ncbi:MAG TPA: hypothetical protein VMU77_04635, partial [Acidimicrobiales bacterium]|nr:hypothetical protein [Acidimicrobiales bacterium]
GVAHRPPLYRFAVQTPLCRYVSAYQQFQSREAVIRGISEPQDPDDGQKRPGHPQGEAGV